MTSCFGTLRSEASTLVRLPPPMRGRGGETGQPRAPAEDIRRQCLNGMMGEDASVVLAMRQTIEQAAPLSLTLPRKGGGNPSACASLTYVDDVRRDARVESELLQ
jgi:hypothetical protein